MTDCNAARLTLGQSVHDVPVKAVWLVTPALLPCGHRGEPRHWCNSCLVHKMSRRALWCAICMREGVQSEQPPSSTYVRIERLNA